VSATFPPLVDWTAWKSAMPLHDHFHAPLDRQTSWDLLHGQWPAMIVLQLNLLLPLRYVAGPHVHLGTETDFLNTDEYEVRSYDVERGRRLVAAVEIVSPSNKDRSESRRVFVAKCEALLRQGVSVAIVDLVTSRHFNLYAELLELIGQRDASLGDGPPAIYAAACRWIERGGKHLLETWSHVLQVGQALPTLPLWLAPNFFVPLDLEGSYEQTCRVLRIV
jgi:hypothetical protein